MGRCPSFVVVSGPRDVGHVSLRGFTWGNVRQLDAVARETLTGLSRQAPLLSDSYAFLDVDSTINRVYGYAKQGAASSAAEAITTARAAGATGVLLARMDSAFDNHAVVSTCIRADVRFSIATRQTRPVRDAIETIEAGSWVPIAYPHAIYDEDSGQWISDAEIAETTYTAFQSRPKSEQITV